MGYEIERYFVKESQKAFLFLMKNLNLSIAEAQRWISKGAVSSQNRVIQKPSEIIAGEIEVRVFKAKPKGLEPIFQTDKFALFDKPSLVLVHPKGRHTDYSLLDEIKAKFGKNANVTHRIDYETSGLVLVSKDINTERYLKELFEKKEIKKRYLALVNGKIERREIINKKISINKEFSITKNRVYIDEVNGKDAVTYINPIRYFKNIDSTLIEAFPITGRTHQIRIHLHSISHTIVGEPLYGQSLEFHTKYLDNNLSDIERIDTIKSKRLMLHSNRIEFRLNSIKYNITSDNRSFYEAIEEVK